MPLKSFQHMSLPPAPISKHYDISTNVKPSICSGSDENDVILKCQFFNSENRDIS